MNMEKYRVKKSSLIARSKRVICTIFIIFILSAVYPVQPINAENLRFGTETVLTRMVSIENVIKGTSHYPAQNGYVTSLDVYLDVDLFVGFGERRDGGLGGYGGPNYIAGQTYTATESGLAESICANLDVTLEPKRMKAALYNPTDKSLIASTLEKMVAVGTGWVTFDFSTPVPITAGNSYMIVYWCEFFQACGTATIREGHAPVNTVTAYVGGANYNTLGGVFPSTLPAGGSTTSWYFNIYVKYRDPPISRNVKGAIYIDLTDAPTNGASLNGPHTFLAETIPITVSESGWHTLYFPSPPTVLAGHRYVLSAWSDSGVGYVGMRYGPIVGLLFEGHSLDAVYDGWPSSPTLIHERPDYYIGGYTKYSAYATYSTTPPWPVAVDDSYSVDEGTTLTVSAPGVLGNDNDPVGNPLTSELVESTSSGSLTLNPDGSFTYSPGINFHGSDSFTYKAKDASLYSNIATVTITVNRVNHPPIADADGPYYANEGSTVNFDGSGSFDPDIPYEDLLQYRWDFDNDGTWDTEWSSSPFVSYTLTSYHQVDRTYVILLEVSDGESTNIAETTMLVVNVLPVVDVGADETIAEGDTFSRSGSFNDPGVTTWSATVDYGEGATAEALLLTDKTFSLSNLYEQDGSYTVTVKVSDNVGYGQDTFTVTVNNVAPTATFSNDGPKDEGSAVTASFTGQADPGTMDTFTYSFDWDNDGNYEIEDQAEASSQYTWTDDGVYRVGSRIKDSDGGYTEYTTDVTIIDLGPTAAFDWSPKPQLEGSAVSFTDQSTSSPDTIASWEWGFGDSVGISTLQSPKYTYVDDDLYVVRLTVTDDDGSINYVEYEVTVSNVDPVVEAGPDQMVGEGDTVSFVGSYTDAGSADTHIIVWSFGDGGTASDSLTPTQVYTDDGVYTVTLTVTDDDGGVGVDTLTVTIIAGNVPPILGPIIAPIDPVKVNILIPASATYTDPDSGDTHTATWEWGDGTASLAVVDQAENQVSGTHTYSTPGIYTLTLTLTDNEGASDSETFQYVVVYDPTGGFVTGGGWIMSPAGAYVQDPSLTGKAHFGFISKYKKGATIPEGNTEFKFQTAGLSFKSEGYEWLVVAGSKAKFKGEGTVNGESGYGFMLSAIDGQPDLFRIKRWDKVTENTIYDNQLGEAIDTDPTTALGGGSIVVHK
jgi:PKD repeat protein